MDDGDLLSAIRSAVPDDVDVGVTGLEPFPHARREIEDRVHTGASGGLGFVFRDPQASTDPAASFPWARSIVVAAVPYLEDGDGPDPSDGGTGRSIARFATGDRYARVRSVLEGIAEVLASGGFRCEMVFDDDRIVDRAVGARAGVGWLGKSTMMITPSAGPWVLIGSVVTDAEIPATPTMRRSCGTCTACIPACPTDAIVSPGVLDANRCIAAVLQRPGSMPRHLRTAVGGRVYGCDECLAACPPGDKLLIRMAPMTDHAAEALHPRTILGWSDREVEDNAPHWYVPKRNPRFVRRNALVALGNTGTVADVGLLAGYAGHPDALLREHAVWALGVLGARDVIAAAAVDETDEAVVGEIEAWIGNEAHR